MKKLTVPGRKYLNCLASPCLQHLVLDYSGRDQYDDLSHFDRNRVFLNQEELVPLLPTACRISPSKLEVLELRISTSTVFTHRVLAPFCNLHTLVIYVDAHFNTVEEDLLAFTFETLGDSISNPCLPKLRTLGLDFERPRRYLPKNVDPEESRYRDALLMARRFVEKRQEHGLPIKALRLLGSLPTGLPSDPNLEWLQNCPAVNLECTKMASSSFADASGFTTVR
jgi:hypothetical protein